MMKGGLFVPAALLYCILFCIASPRSVEAGAYQDGYKDGQDKAKELWETKYNKDCRNIFEYSVDVKDTLLRGEYKASSADNWYDESFKHGGRNGSRDEMLSYQQDCVTPTECDTLGETAAERIVADFCQVPPTFSVVSGDTIDPVIFCRETATRTCQGKLVDTIDAQHSCPIIDDNVANLTREQSSELQEECEYMVDDFINWDEWNA